LGAPYGYRSHFRPSGPTRYDAFPEAWGMQ